MMQHFWLLTRSLKNIFTKGQTYEILISEVLETLKHFAFPLFKEIL